MNYIANQQIMKAEVVDIKWERVHLHLFVKLEIYKPEMINKDEPFCFFPVEHRLGTAPGEFKVIDVKDNVYHMSLNVTRCGDNVIIPSGSYILQVCQKDNILADCYMSEELVPRIDACSQTFLYGERRRNYSVCFYVKEGEEELVFEMATLLSSMNLPASPKITTLRSRIHPLKDLTDTLLSTKNFHRRMYALFYRLNKSKRDKTILFLTEQNDSIRSNLLAVKNRMEERGLDKEYTILTSARFAGAGNLGVKSWLETVKKIASAGLIFVDDHAPVFDWMTLSKDTKVIQLWHAGAGFKSSGYSRWGHPGCPSPYSAHRQYTYGISGSKTIAHFFSEVWGMDDAFVLPTGMPRMDEYLDPKFREAKTQELYEKYPLCKGKKVILFAPTYRGRNKVEAFYPYDLIDFKAFYELCKDEYVVLFKMHPWVAKKVPIPKEYQDKMIDVGKYPNINDLFYFTDLLITDYSSNIFEYSLMEKPMLFFAYDKIQYSFSRGFHRAYEESAPGKVCYDFESVLKAIENKDFEFEKVKEYIDYSFDYIDSGASDRVIDWFVLDQIPDKFKTEIQQVLDRRKEIAKMTFTSPYIVLQDLTK